jgi:hypothetical protein
MGPRLTETTRTQPWWAPGAASSRPETWPSKPPLPPYPTASRLACSTSRACSEGQQRPVLVAVRTARLRCSTTMLPRPDEQVRKVIPGPADEGVRVHEQEMIVQPQHQVVTSPCYNVYGAGFPNSPATLHPTRRRWCSLVSGPACHQQRGDVRKVLQFGSWTATARPPRRADGRVPTLRRSSILRSRTFVQLQAGDGGETLEPRPLRSSGFTHEPPEVGRNTRLSRGGR